MDQTLDPPTLAYLDELSPWLPSWPAQQIDSGYETDQFPAPAVDPEQAADPKNCWAPLRTKRPAERPEDARGEKMVRLSLTVRLSMTAESVAFDEPGFTAKPVTKKQRRLDRIRKVKGPANPHSRPRAFPRECTERTSPE